MNNNTFFSKENLKLTVNILKDYMAETYALSLDDENEGLTRKLLFDLIKKVDDECRDKPQIPLQAKNLRVLNVAKELLIKRFNLSERQKKPNIQNLSRDKSIYGDREVKTTAMIPEINTYSKKTQNEQKEMLIERMISERDREIGIEKKMIPDVDKIIVPIIDKSEGQDDFIKKLKDFESQRNIIIEDIETKRPQPKNPDEQMFQQNIMMERIAAERDMNEYNNIQNQDPKAIMATISNSVAKVPVYEDAYSKFSEGKEFTVIPKNPISKKIEKYLSINSSDRNWLIQPNRYEYSVDFLANKDKTNCMQNRYRNIESLAVSKVIIPDEIIQFNDPIKSSFNYEFTFAYPYLILSIDEFHDVYDGTNDAVRKAFCTLAFDKAYKGQNGRGYVVLKPIQKEVKYFYPAFLSSLNKLSISILKPNGSLFNSSADSYNILKILYDNSNPNFLEITTDSYFDKNEFYIGDFILIKNYLMTQLSVFQNTADILSFNNYINNPLGFEITLLGTANVNGYYNIFNINAPGNFNKSIGQYQVNTNLINCLTNYNNQISTPVINGNIMNSSLQNSIAMKVKVVVDDANILDTQSSFNF
jgi:hypothetical protein